MRIFISWSGDRSKAVASALKVWLKDVFQTVEPWMSSHDILPGDQWLSELREALELSHFGILCLTLENLKAPWLLFEAGCLAKAMAPARVVPYLFGLSHGDLLFPVNQFQYAQSGKDGDFQLAQSINRSTSPPLLEAQYLNKAFTKWWPDLKKKLKRIPPVPMTLQPRTDRELLEEMLELLRWRPQVSSTPAPITRQEGSSHVTPAIEGDPNAVWTWGRLVQDINDTELQTMNLEHLELYLDRVERRWRFAEKSEEAVLEGRLAAARREKERRSGQ
jgi:TIR domain